MIWFGSKIIVIRITIFVLYHLLYPHHHHHHEIRFGSKTGAPNIESRRNSFKKLSALQLSSLRAAQVMVSDSGIMKMMMILMKMMMIVVMMICDGFEDDDALLLLVMAMLLLLTMRRILLLLVVMSHH